MLIHREGFIELRGILDGGGERIIDLRCWPLKFSSGENSVSVEGNSKATGIFWNLMVSARRLLMRGYFSNEPRGISKTGGSRAQ